MDTVPNARRKAGGRTDTMIEKKTEVQKLPTLSSAVENQVDKKIIPSAIFSVVIILVTGGYLLFSVMRSIDIEL